MSRKQLIKTASTEVLSRVVEIQQEIALSHLEFDQLLSLICERTQELTRASGAVVELIEGEDLVYRGASGSLKDSVGARVKSKSSLSGKCAKSGKSCLCLDTELDPRVDREACRVLRIRSMLLVPLQYQTNTFGVLKVTSPEAGYFKEEDETVLTLLAGLLGSALRQASEAQARAVLLKSLQESEAKFRGLFEAAYDGMMTSSDGVIVEVNTAWCKMFGYEAEELVGKQAVTLLAERVRERTAEYIRTGFDQPYETIGLRKNGSEFVVEGVGKSIELGGRMLRVTAARDISSRKSREEQLIEANKALSAATKAKSEFLANMSHEIRTPINGVVGMTSLLLDTELTREQRDYCEHIRTSADNLLTLINDILDFSKIEAGKMSIETIDYEVDLILQDVERTLGFSARKKGLKLVKSVSSDVPMMVKGDPTRVRQVLLNLVNNAIKFTPQGRVELNVSVDRAGTSGARLRFDVADTGIGIPPQALAKLFEAFQQADTSTTRRFGGTGLGLSICRHLARLMDGEIEVRSIEGSGSTFSFVMPLVEAKATPRPAQGPVIQLPATRKLRILVAEDNAVNQVIAVKMLERLGHSAVAVGNGHEVLDALRDAPYDLVLMDCQMPEMDGYQATKLIRSNRTLSCTEIPIIALTANAMKGDRERCLEVGMNDYVSKPVKITDLAESIARVIAPREEAAA